MIVIHLVGDGPRDEAMIPPLVEAIVGQPIRLATIQGDLDFERRRHWKNIRVRNGYAGKLLFAILEAVEARASGLVAVIDRDKESSGDRMKKLAEGRDQHRSKNAPFPTALGEAQPHGEAWLLDDPAGVIKALGLPRDLTIVSVHKSLYPKDDLDRLIAQASLNEMDIKACLAQIARCIDIQRCNHAKETGLLAFVQDIRTELGPLIASGVGGSRGPREHPAP